MTMLSKDEAQALLKKVIALSKAETCEANLNGNTNGNIRTARNSVSTSGVQEDLQLVVQSSYGQRSGTTTINELDDASLEKAVRRSEELAKLAPENPEFMPPLEPQQYLDAPGWVDATAKITPEFRAKGAADSINASKAKKLVAAGFLQDFAGFQAMLNSKGLFAYYPSTNVNFTVTVRSEDGTGSGYAAADANDVAEMDTAKTSGVAIDKALFSMGAKAIEPGKYTVILEPAAVAGLLGPLGWGGMSAKETDEGRTFLAGKVGKKLVSERVVLESDPFHPGLVGRPWFAGGIPNRKVTWIDGGAFVNLSYDRFTAKKHGVEPTPDPDYLVMRGGTDTIDGLIAGTERGILVTHFWYVRFVDPMTMLLTGMTRDGLFAIEDGKVTGGIKNFRWNMSTVDMLANVQGMTAAETTSDVEADPMVLPALKVADWNFTSPTTF